jgi:hypothetical protein
VGTSGRREDIRKRSQKAIWWKYSVHMHVNEKNETFCNYSTRMGRKGIRENDGGGEFNYDKL